MSGLVTTGEKNLVLVSGRAHMDLAHAVGEEIGCGVSPVTAYDFASGEIYVRFNESVRGADVFVLQSIEGDITNFGLSGSPTSGNCSNNSDINQSKNALYILGELINFSEFKTLITPRPSRVCNQSSRFNAGSPKRLVAPSFSRVSKAR